MTSPYGLSYWKLLKCELISFDFFEMPAGQPLTSLTGIEWSIANIWNSKKKIFYFKLRECLYSFIKRFLLKMYLFLKNWVWRYIYIYFQRRSHSTILSFVYWVRSIFCAASLVTGGCAVSTTWGICTGQMMLTSPYISL